ncbi:MAG: tRNA (N(6)-L-threonylcarbamoyladenosine(37)-C(2))-methylthiotransferase [Candidatus Bathyarchaeota archaeon]|nr:tRNA (N(6)-L-threonylcarbamoyladenosine(37)-C(2))-methylthiotransferase [Candidatus Bathyarchaeota archaeon]MDH5746872.1 tRNA (N(6)-L-threonylcarbamoyladenosine(37)-C(2))-methylthiotransferase [Candidatus Bathyarchaeota archaeon]
MEKMRVFIKSFGCSTNSTDGEVLAGCLAEAGYKLVDTVEAADIVIYNTCAVKGPTENRMMGVLKRVPADKKLIVVGCLPLINFERLCREVRFDGVLGPAAGERIVDVVMRVLNGERVVALQDVVNAKPSLNLPRLRLNPVIGIVPINYGCLGSCAYCCVVFARGRLRSYGIPEIVERVKRDMAMGIREFWVTSQDTACYGRDNGTNLAELLKALCDVEGDFRVRVGMMTPNLAKSILEDLIQAFRSEKIFNFVHLPVQSGDNQVLKRMRRFYSIDDFKDIVNAFRASFSKVTVATDVICGFPGETEEAFERTLCLIEDVKPDIVNVSKFFARPRTVAAEMREDFVPFPEIKRRSGLGAELARRVAAERNRSWVGWTGEILVDEVGKVPGSWVGRNFAYKSVVLKNAILGNILGKTLRVRIVKAFATYLEGEVVE